MAELSIREIQLSCFDVMKAFDAFCRANQLTYFLSGGTLLGAVRHKGFIPWDDDVDLMMPRADYQRMLTIPFPDANYGFFSLEAMPEYSRAWVRMTDKRTRLANTTRFTGDTMATYIDIFPIDGIPAGKWATRWYFARIRILDALCKCAKRNFLSPGERFSGLKKVLRVLLAPIGAHRFAVWMNRVARRYPFEGSAYRGVTMVTHYGAREKMPAEVFDHAVDVEFEGVKMPAPVGYDTYLTNLYGDYMTPPPAHRQMSDHMSVYAKKEDS